MTYSSMMYAIPIEDAAHEICDRQYMTPIVTGFGDRSTIRCIFVTQFLTFQSLSFFKHSRHCQKVTETYHKFTRIAQLSAGYIL